MLTYSIMAQVANNPMKAAAWAREAVELAKKFGGAATASSRLGGPGQIIWVVQYDDFAAFEKAQATLFADPAYSQLLDKAQTEGLFVPGSVETAFWMPL